ncbi:MAG: toxin-antitoxin system HicB family antitoxin [Cyanobacteria bacterium HKST-UBA02]|nr:toxin-antitoxin system HicB family antitoxin [Candidatus Melainabacteria bacterium]MCA9802862.1 toxin-antitoxin system HicB family antitoxin [Cyanobacteria bacterium HKST-UBA02]
MAVKKTKAKAKAKPAARKPAKAKVARKATAAKKPARKLATKAKAPARKAKATKVKAAPRSAARGGDDFLKFSGKFTVRLPKSLHQALVERAEKEGVSLNLFVTNALSRTVAMPSKKR